MGIRGVDISKDKLLQACIPGTWAHINQQVSLKRMGSTSGVVFESTVLSLPDHQELRACLTRAGAGCGKNLVGHDMVCHFDVAPDDNAVSGCAPTRYAKENQGAYAWGHRVKPGVFPPGLQPTWVSPAYGGAAGTSVEASAIADATTARLIVSQIHSLMFPTLQSSEMLPEDRHVRLRDMSNSFTGGTWLPSVGTELDDDGGNAFDMDCETRSENTFTEGLDTTAGVYPPVASSKIFSEIDPAGGLQITLAIKQSFLEASELDDLPMSQQGAVITSVGIGDFQGFVADEMIVRAGSLTSDAIKSVEEIAQVLEQTQKAFGNAEMELRCTLVSTNAKLKLDLQEKESEVYKHLSPFLIFFVFVIFLSRCSTDV